MSTTVFDILRRPVVTEKSNYLASKLNQYVFEVASFATREQVKTAIETAFDVNVEQVNIINLHDKEHRNTRTRKLAERANDYKKAIVTLKQGESIPVFEGVD